MMAKEVLTFGFSPCPNDTYMFYALTKGILEQGGLRLRFTIEDVETLNHLALERGLDISKVSCHAYCYLKDDYRFLSYGAAFGKGCGPIVVSRQAFGHKTLSGLKIAIPGRYTTANLLWHLYADKHGIDIGDIVVMPFDRIMPAVRDGLVDIGVVIHEGRFTYRDYGLQELVDLGQWWEDDTGLPIPLGGIVARKDIGEAAISTIERLIRESIVYADKHVNEAMPFIKAYAQELSEDVIRDHIRLYVNDYSRGFTDQAQRALQELIKRKEGVKKGWIEP